MDKHNLFYGLGTILDGPNSKVEITIHPNTKAILISKSIAPLVLNLPPGTYMADASVLEGCSWPSIVMIVPETAIDGWASIPPDAIEKLIDQIKNKENKKNSTRKSSFTPIPNDN